MKNQFKHLIALVILMAMGAIIGNAQKDTTNDFESLSLQDLLDVKIVSASKSNELLFDAPLSASVLTRLDIRRAGSTTIMEALRLIPGMIVREQTNGNYDIYLRGMDGVPPNSAFEGSSTTTLVMIDGRPIYNYLKGGTFWETLPIDLNDVEKIEVIRGPAAALYGPNAVNGVINIITRQTVKDGLYVTANSQQGSFQSIINNASIGFQKRRWSLIASGNYQGRQRSQTSYFELMRNMWLDNPPYYLTFLTDTVASTNSDTRAQAMRKYAGNLFLTYEPADEIKFTAAGGLQHSIVQRVSTENGITPISTVVSDSRYMDLRGTIKKFNAQLSYIKGTQTPTYPGSMYDFTTLDANLDYTYTKGNLIIKPGISYRRAVYDDTKYADVVAKSGIFNARGEIITRSASLRAEYKLFDNKLRLVAGMAFNNFNLPDTTYNSYQLAATYKINKNHLIRAVISRSPRSSTIYDAYVDQRASLFPIGYQKYAVLNLQANKNIQLLLSDMMEVGYRGNILSNLHIDIELFDIKSRNFSSLVVHQEYMTVSGSDTLIVTPTIPTNIPLKLHQQGITVALTYQSGKLQVKPFVTIQRSTIKNYTPFATMPDITSIFVQTPPGMNIYSGMGNSEDAKSTPRAFGGASINYQPRSSINFNLNAYYYSKQTYTHLTNIMFNDGLRGIDHLQSKLILNAKISYEAVKGFHLFGSAKNIFNQRSREFFKTDDMPFMIYGGINIEF